MTTDAPLTDDEKREAWVHWRRHVWDEKHGPNGADAFAAGADWLAARLDALHAENERLRTLNNRLRGDAANTGRIRAERDALRAAITALADDWEARAMTCCRLTCENCGARYIDPDDLRALLSEAGERRE